MSETSLTTLLKRPQASGSQASFFDEDISYKSSFTGPGSYSYRSRSRRSETAGNLSNLSVRNESRNFNTINFVPSESLLATENWGMIETMSLKDQEILLMEQLLFVLAGSQSSLIQVHDRGPQGIAFTIDGRVENSLKDLALQIAQLAVYYHSVTKFAEKFCKFEHGQVNQALSAALRETLKDYFMLLSQSETLMLKGDLSLQKMMFFLHPTLQTMKILSSIASALELRDCRGGQVLSLLHEKAVSMVGDAAGQALCYTLARSASTPYFTILENWIYKGMIRDPFNEFFITDTDREDEIKLEVNDNDNYWETRYKLVLEKCPSFLRNVSQEILKAGKYLNVIRQCGKDVCMDGRIEIRYSTHERVYVSAIEKAYVFASKTLLDLLLNEYDLMRRLKSVKHYLLMDQGDFIVQYLELTENELSRPIGELNPVRLESLLELALRTSSSSTDPYKDCVKVELFGYGIAEQMLKIMAIGTPLEQEKFQMDLNTPLVIPGFEGFSFTYEVQWPISLVLNSRAIACYQMIFRHLFYCKHVERQLCKVWLSKKSFKNSDLSEETDKAATFSLHQQMLNFVQSLQYYMAFEVIEPAWHAFISTMGKVTNVDEVLTCHLTMVNSILDDSMLTNPSLLARMTTLLTLCSQFSEKMVRNPEELLDSTTPEVSVEDLTQSFRKELVEFLREVSHIVQNPNQSSKVANIIYRVNFNGFYTDALEV